MLTRFLAPLAFLIGLGAVASAQVTVNHHSGFLSPTGMHGVQGSSMGSGFIVSEAGTGANDGRVTFLEDGTFNRQTVVAALPSIISGSCRVRFSELGFSPARIRSGLPEVLDPHRGPIREFLEKTANPALSQRIYRGKLQ